MLKTKNYSYTNYELAEGDSGDDCDGDSGGYTSSITEIDPRPSRTETMFAEEQRLHCSR